MFPSSGVQAYDSMYYDEISTNHRTADQLKSKSCDVIGEKNGILLSKLFWPTGRKNCSRDREKLLKFEAEGWEFEIFLRSLEQFIQTVKGQNNFW